MDYIDIGPRGREEERAVSIVREGGRATSTGIILCQAVNMDYIDRGPRGREGGRTASYTVRECNIYRDYIVSSCRHRIYISCGLFYFLVGVNNKNKSPRNLVSPPWNFIQGIGHYLTSHQRNINIIFISVSVMFFIIKSSFSPVE